MADMQRVRWAQREMIIRLHGEIPCWGSPFRVPFGAMVRTQCVTILYEAPTAAR